MIAQWYRRKAVTHETDVNMCCMSQISRLTWFTRFDPVKSSEENKEAGTLTIDNGLQHDQEKSPGNVAEHTNGAFSFIQSYSF